MNPKERMEGVRHRWFGVVSNAGRHAWLMAGVMLVVVVSGFTTTADATHYRYGHIHWSPGAQPNEINFRIQNVWRRNQGDCINPTTGGTTACTGPGGLPGVGDIHRQGASTPVFFFGDGSTFSFPGGILHLVTSIDLDSNSYFGEVVDHTQFPAVVTTVRHTYAAPGNYVAFFPDCCRISPSSFPNRHINNPDRISRIETLVNVGTGNSSPVALVPTIMPCPIDAICTFNVAAADPDGDQLRFRFSTPQEAALHPNFGQDPFIQPGPPNAPNAATINPNTGEYTWDTTGASLGGVDPTVWNVLYSTQVTIEDLDAAGNVKSKVAVDFFIQLVPVVGQPPEFTAGPCGQTLNVTVGGALNFTVEASDPDPAEQVTLNVVGLPAGATMSPPLPAVGNPVSSKFDWTPGAGQVGTHIMTFTAVDSDGQAAPVCSITVIVEDVGDQGCSQGFWRQPHHFGHWQGHDPDDLFCDVFDCSTPASINAYGGKTLHQVLIQGGGQLRALGRQAVAALLNASSSVAYNLSEAQVIQKVNGAIASDNNSEIEAVKDELDELNNMGCPLPNTADMNVDGFVDGGDLVILLGNWGQPGLGDINKDGVVDGADLLLLLSNWGWQPAPWTPYQLPSPPNRILRPKPLP